MPLTAQEVSVGVFVRGLASLKSLLTKGEAYASAHAMDPAELIEARLAQDMYALAAQDLEAGLVRTIELTHRGGSVTFTGSQFLLQFAIPNFFFHVTTAYGILRQKGVQVTKGDFTGMTFG